MLVTKEKMKAATTAKGGFTKDQILLARDFLGDSKKFKRKMIGMNVPDEFWERFVAASGKRVSGRKSKVINPYPAKKDDWSWRPDGKDIPEIKRNVQNKQHKKSRKGSKLLSKKFYESKEWRELRVRVLEKYECKCMMCGRSPKDHGVVIHVDHIKPRSKYPHLQLAFDNLQLLCEDCNLGKRNKYQTDWRPDAEQEISEELDRQLLLTSPL